MVTAPEAHNAPTDILVQDAIARVRAWLNESRAEPVDAAAARLAGVLQDPHGLEFTVGFVDGVIRPEDVRVAAQELARLVPLTPRFLPLPLRLLIRAGAALGRVAPGIVVPTARLALRQMVRHLIVDAGDRKLGRAIARLRSDGVKLNINLLGEAILGEREAARRVEGTTALLRRPDVDYVSIKVSSTVAPHNPWSFDAAVSHAVDALRPLFEIAAHSPGGPTFINLDMEEYKDLDLTIAVFTTLLDEPRFHDLEAGIVLQAYLPDALGAMIRLQEWASDRVAAGGAPIKVRVVKGANLPMERVDAELHGWPLATWPSKLASDASYKAVLDYALHPERTRHVRIGLAGHNLFDIAYASLLAERRGVADDVEVEMLLGMATAQAAVVRRHLGGVLLYTPVVHPEEFDVAIAYLIRRLEEGASQENFMSAVFDLGTDQALFDREQARFLASLDAVPTEVPQPNRTQDRRDEPEPASPDRFANTPDTDTSLAGNRTWGSQIRARMRDSELGVAEVAATRIATEDELTNLIEETVAAGARWRELTAAGRAEILHRAGDELERRRAALLEVMGAECGKLLDQGDPEVSEAIDFAHYYAERGKDLAAIDGATPRPVGLVVVTPPWNFPVAIPAGSTLAALAAGAPVILKPAPASARSAAVMVEALWAAGVPRDVLRLAPMDDEPLGAALIRHPAVERVILTGAYETAELFGRLRPDVRVLGETSGKNAMIITASADLDLAAKDLAASAFGHAGQKCSAASLAILVGPVARSRRFMRQLRDAVTSYRIGYPWQEEAQVGPLIGPAEGKLHRALTELEPGQQWVLEPAQLDAEGALWRPGIRTGVQPGSEFHLTEYFGPVLGLMSAPTLADAIAIVNQIDYGLTSGLHSLDAEEIQQWLAGIEAGNLYVNRGITGAIVQRQPFGGWRRSAVGGSAKAGGPNYLTALVDWQDTAPGEAVSASDPGDRFLAETLAVASGADLPAAELRWLEAALASDVLAGAEFTGAHDPTGLISEHNVFRYHPVGVTVRAEEVGVAALIRTVAAGLRLGSPVTVSIAEDRGPALPEVVRAWLADRTSLAIEDAQQWHRRVASLAETGGRIRLLGAGRDEVSEAAGGSPAVAIIDGDVVSAGRVTGLTFVREQAVSITAHRFGTPRSVEVPPVIGAPQVDV